MPTSNVEKIEIPLVHSEVFDLTSAVCSQCFCT